MPTLTCCRLLLTLLPWPLLPPLLLASNRYCHRTAVLQYCRDRKHAKPMWFCVVSCHILWFTFTKAIFNVIKKKITGETFTDFWPGTWKRLSAYIAVRTDCMLTVTSSALAMNARALVLRLKLLRTRDRHGVCMWGP